MIQWEHDAADPIRAERIADAFDHSPRLRIYWDPGFEPIGIQLLRTSPVFKTSIAPIGGFFLMDMRQLADGSFMAYGPYTSMERAKEVAEDKYGSAPSVKAEKRRAYARLYHARRRQKESSK